MLDIFIKEVKEKFHIELSDKQIKQFDVYYNFLIEYNQKVNLTRITEETEVYFKHFFDSLMMINTIDLNQYVTICDMGAGAGFPSIPLRIIYPHLKVTIIDSLGKRIKFLESLLEQLQINDVKLIYDRIEMHAMNHQKEFDIVTARALGSLQLILELGLPMVKVGKLFIAYKASNYQEEIKDAENALNVLKGQIIDLKEIELPFDMGFRSHIVIRKDKHVTGYPRAFAAIKKHPL